MPFTYLTRLDATIRAGGVAIGGVNVNGLVSPASLQAAAQPIIDAFDDSAAAQLVWQNLQDRTTGSANLGGADTSPLYKVMRAEAAVLVDEINVVREWVVSFKAAVAASTSLANMQTRVAALPDLPDRTLAQAKTAIQTKITNGVAD